MSDTQGKTRGSKEDGNTDSCRNSLLPLASQDKLRGGGDFSPGDFSPGGSGKKEAHRGLPSLNSRGVPCDTEVKR
ncbi:hypothetical protein ES705_37581 [subsurface metagenome]